MLTTFEVYLYTTVLFLVPLVVHSMITNVPPPANTWIGKYYHVEKHLLLVGNLFLLSLCAVASGKLGLHFGLVDPALAGRVEWITNMPFTLLFFVYVAMWIRAAIKTRRMEKNGA